MICIECRSNKPEKCRNYYNDRGEKRDIPTKTWCDSGHRSGITIDPQFCRHFQYDESTMTYCPSCGKDLGDEVDKEGEETIPTE